MTYFNESQVNALIRLLGNYSDDYSKALLQIFTDYLLHQDFSRMSKEYSNTESNDGLKARTRWDVRTCSMLLEVIYPVVEESK